MAAELQLFADTNDIKGFYQSMKAIWGSRVSHPDQLLASDSVTLLTEKQDLLARWTEHFSKLPNETPEMDKDDIETSPSSKLDGQMP